jgi:hypothetical protein
MRSDDIVNIINVVNIYPIAVDTQQWDLFDLAFTPDIAVDFGGAAVWGDLGSFKSAFAAIHAPFESTQHVAVFGDAASCLSYVHGRFIRTVPQGRNMFESSGWYDDRFVRTPDGWRISKRVCRMQWWDGNPAVLETMPGVKVEHVLNTLRGDAAAGNIHHISRLRESSR